MAYDGSVVAAWWRQVRGARLGRDASLATCITTAGSAYHQHAQASIYERASLAFLKMVLGNAEDC